MSEQPQQQRNRIKLEIPANLRAVYANFALIAHTGTEFFVDFSQLLPGMNKSQVHTRVVMSPTHAKMLYRALGENLERYEAKHGVVDVPPSLADQLFGSVRQEDEDDDPDSTDE